MFGNQLHLYVSVTYVCEKILRFEISVINKNVNYFTKLPPNYKILIKIAFFQCLERDKPTLSALHNFASGTGRKEGHLTYDMLCLLSQKLLTLFFFGKTMY